MGADTKIPKRLTQAYKNEKKSEPERILEAYTGFKNGSVSRDDYFYVIWRALQHLVKDLIKKYNRTMNAEYDDLIVEAQAQVLEHLSDYDPTRGTMPSTFFLRYINEAHRDMCRGDISTYYIGAISRLNKAAIKAGFDGIDDIELTDAQLAMISGESVSTVQAARENYVAGQHWSLADVNDEVKDIYHDGPEDIVCVEEKKETGMMIFRSLLELEQMIIYEMRVNGKSSKKVCQMLLKDDHYKDYGLKKRPTQDDVMRRLNAAERKLATHRLTKKYNGTGRDSDDDDFELISQLSYDDIDEAVESGILDEI